MSSTIKPFPALFAFALLGLLILCSPSQVRADPLVITGGMVSIFGAPNSRNAFRGVSFNFNGAGFSVSGGTSDGQGRQRPEGPCAFEACQPGTSVSASSLVHSDGLGSATINGTSYGVWFFGGDTLMTFTGGPSVVIPNTGESLINISTSFSMTGTLVIHDLNDPNLAVVFTSPITGQGTATLTFQLLTGSTFNTGYYLSRINYQFSDPVPEPATLVLLGTGLAGMAGAYRRRRKQRQ